MLRPYIIIRDEKIVIANHITNEVLFDVKRGEAQVIRTHDQHTMNLYGEWIDMEIYLSEPVNHGNVSIERDDIRRNPIQNEKL